MARRKTTPTTSTSEEKTDPAPPEVAAAKEPDKPEQANEPASPPSLEPEVQLQPAEFRREGRQTICTVCGTEARLDFDQQLFCPNAHNHPPLPTETVNS